jgi:NAD-dependent histone deacetylase SIR2
MNNHDISSPLSSRHSDTCPSTPSSPLSELGRTPSPFPEQCSLPSPFSTLPSDAESPSRSRELTPTDRDGPPPPKKRKLTEPKKRTTEYLELGAFDSCAKSTPSSHEELQFDRLCKALRTKQKIVVIAGAGISVSAGSKQLSPSFSCVT